MDIFTKIRLHEHVYEMQGDPVPPFRITCEEHKILVNSIGTHKGMIAYYRGIRLEVVTLVQEYC